MAVLLFMLSIINAECHKTNHISCIVMLSVVGLRTNTLAYFDLESIMNLKGFMITTPGLNVMKLFYVRIIRMSKIS